MHLFIVLTCFFASLMVRADLVTSFTIVGDDNGWITTNPITATPDEYTFAVGLSPNGNQMWIEASKDLGGPDSDLLQLYMTSRDEIIESGKTYSWSFYDALDGKGWTSVTGKPAGTTQIRSTGDGGSTVIIHELEFNPDNSIKTLAIDFRVVFWHWNYFGPEKVDIGEIRIGSSYPTTIVPEPTSATLLVMSLLFLRAFIARRKT